MTLDEIFAEAKNLNNGDLEVLASALAKERNDRLDKQRQEAWSRLCEAIAHYTANYGSIDINDYSDGTSLTLNYGHFEFNAYGDIELN